MIGKRIQIDDDMWQAINLLRQERRRSFQQLATEALRDLLEKHHRAVSLKDQLKESLVEATTNSSITTVAEDAPTTRDSKKVKNPTAKVRRRGPPPRSRKGGAKGTTAGV
jgi:hypothetical protein